MVKVFRVPIPVWSILVLGASLWVGNADADPVIWTGPTVTFSKMGTDNPTLPQHQDRLTDNVWLTRGSSEGIFNIAQEPAYVRFSSPADTKWATGVMTANMGQSIAATNHMNLAFTDWAPAYGGSGVLINNITTEKAVVHLVSDNIYLELMFTQFNSGGLVAYERTSPSAPSPTGDYNGNGVVDAGDYVIWRETLDQAAVPAGSGADGNANGTIDPGDYAFWRARFGNEAPGSGAGPIATVPEPATVLLLLIGSLALAWRLK